MPTVESISPTTCQRITPTVIHVTGTGFVDGSTVSFPQAGVKIRVLWTKYLSATLLAALVTADSDATLAAARNLRVTNPDMTNGGLSAALTIVERDEYIMPQPSDLKVYVWARRGRGETTAAHPFWAMSEVVQIARVEIKDPDNLSGNPPGTGTGTYDTPAVTIAGQGVQIANEIAWTYADMIEQGKSITVQEIPVLLQDYGIGEDNTGEPFGPHDLCESICSHIDDVGEGGDWPDISLGKATETILNREGVGINFDHAYTMIASAIDKLNNDYEVPGFPRFWPQDNEDRSNGFEAHNSTGSDSGWFNVTLADVRSSSDAHQVVEDMTFAEAWAAAVNIEGDPITYNLSLVASNVANIEFDEWLNSTCRNAHERGLDAAIGSVLRDLVSDEIVLMNYDISATDSTNYVPVVTFESAGLTTKLYGTPLTYHGASAWKGYPRGEGFWRSGDTLDQWLAEHDLTATADPPTPTSVLTDLANIYVADMIAWADAAAAQADGKISWPWSAAVGDTWSHPTLEASFDANYPGQGFDEAGCLDLDLTVDLMWRVWQAWLDRDVRRINLFITSDFSDQDFTDNATLIAMASAYLTVGVSASGAYAEMTNLDGPYVVMTNPDGVYVEMTNPDGAYAAMTNPDGIYVVTTNPDGVYAEIMTP